MTGSCIIDGIDIYTDFGAYITKGGDVDLMSFPERKTPESNDWFEYSGIDVDLTESYFNNKKVRISFFLKSEYSREFVRKLDAFYRLLSAKGYRNVYVRELNTTFELRYLSCPEYEHRGFFSKSGMKSAIITVEFSQDDPFQFIDLSILNPINPRQSLTCVSINSIDLSQFGIIVNKIYSGALILPGQKDVLLRESDTMSGIIADINGDTTYKQFSFTLSCTMLAPSLSEFIINYSALFNTLNSTDSLSLKLVALPKTIKCYYSKMESFIKRHAFKTGVNVVFDIVLTSVDFKFLKYLFSTENSKIIISENNKLITIE